MSLILAQKKTNTKIHKFNPYQIKSQMQQLTHIPTENTSTNIHGKQQNIYNIDIWCRELNKRILIANTLKGKSEQWTEDKRIVDSNNNQSNTEEVN